MVAQKCHAINGQYQEELQRSDSKHLSSPHKLDLLKRLYTQRCRIFRWYALRSTHCTTTRYHVRDTADEGHVAARMFAGELERTQKLDGVGVVDLAQHLNLGPEVAQRDGGAALQDLGRHLGAIPQRLVHDPKLALACAPAGKLILHWLFCSLSS